MNAVQAIGILRELERNLRGATYSQIRSTVGTLVVLKLVELRSVEASFIGTDTGNRSKRQILSQIADKLERHKLSITRCSF